MEIPGLSIAMKSSTATVAAIADYLHSFAPSALAAEWDNVGLLLGDRAVPVKKAMTCLTVTPQSAAEAIEGGAQLIVSHHPILFRPVQKLTRSNAEGRMLLDLIAAGVAVFSPHTAFDNTTGGINDLLAQKLGLIEVAPLRRGEGARQVKIVVFVPDSDLERVADAMFAAGAGQIGSYRECSFRLSGIGTFFGTESANPAVGQKGRREQVDEWRLEAICPTEKVAHVTAAIRLAHSYEEPAYDVYPLQPGPARHGEGRLGRLPKPGTLAAVARKVKSSLKAKQVQVVGDPARPIHKIAIACGAGGEFLKDAVHAHVDVLLTGEMRFHDFLSARAQDLALILPGHYATERPGIEDLAERLGKQFPEVKVWASSSESDPVAWV
jgi:dinuclear metal center YbgI/SA1388 family protein